MRARSVPRPVPGLAPANAHKHPRKQRIRAKRNPRSEIAAREMPKSDNAVMNHDSHEVSTQPRRCRRAFGRLETKRVTSHVTRSWHPYSISPGRQTAEGGWREREQPHPLVAPLLGQPGLSDS